MHLILKLILNFILINLISMITIYAPLEKMIGFLIDLSLEDYFHLHVSRQLL